MADERRPVYDEKASKILVMALLAQTDTEIVQAINGLRRHMGEQRTSGHDAKVFFAQGGEGTWMQGLMRLQEKAYKDMLKAQEQTRVYKARLALVEAALRRFRSILKAVSGSDTKDHLLQWAIDNQTTIEIKMHDSDQSDDPTDMALARLYETAGPVD